MATRRHAREALLRDSRGALSSTSCWVGGQPHIGARARVYVVTSKDLVRGGAKRPRATQADRRVTQIVDRRNNKQTQSRARPPRAGTRGDDRSPCLSWLRTNGVNTNGAAAKVRILVRLEKKVRPGTFGKINVG